MAQARRRDPQGDNRVRRAEALALPDADFDLVAAYLSLIDIDGLAEAIREVHRMLRPGGHFLIASLQSLNTASTAQGWTREPDGTRRFCIDDYFEERPIVAEWQGISIRNWHRPMWTWLQAPLDTRFTLTHFDEPDAQDVEDDKAKRRQRVPNLLVMEWRRPG